MSIQVNLENALIEFINTQASQKISKILMSHKTRGEWIHERVQKCASATSGKFSDPLGVSSISVMGSAQIPIEEDNSIPDGEFRFYITSINFYNPKDPKRSPGA